MIIPILIFVLTIVLGPLMFWYMSNFLYADLKLKKFPVGIHDGLGDTLFLPLFNFFLIDIMLATNHYFRLSWAFLALALAFMFTLFYTYRDLYIGSDLNWSKPKKYHYNYGGIYHSVFMMFQSAIIIYGLVFFTDYLLLWAMLIGYLALVALQYGIFKEI